MTSRVVVAVIVPGLQVQAWIAGLRSAVEAAGWVYHEDWGEAWIRPAESNCFVVSWTDVLPQGDAVVVVVGGVDDAVAGCAAFYQLSEADGRRLASARLAGASDLIAGGALVLRPDRLNYIPGIGDIPELQGKVAPSPNSPLAFYETLPPSIGASASWTADLMWEGHDPIRPAAEGAIDLTGRARLLRFGPFLTLPQGFWQVDVDLTIEVETTRLLLTADWGVGLDLETLDLSIEQSGRYQLSLVREWRSPGLAQFRLALKRAVFSGRLNVEQIVCRRVVSPDCASMASEIRSSTLSIGEMSA